MNSRNQVTFQIKENFFVGPLWHAFADSYCRAGGPETFVKGVEIVSRSELADGVMVRITSQERVHVLKCRGGDADELAAMDATLGRGWNWAREAHSNPPCLYSPIRRDDTLCVIAGTILGSAGGSQCSITFSWSETASTLAIVAKFQRGSAGLLSDRLSIIPGLKLKEEEERGQSAAAAAADEQEGGVGV